LKIIRKHRLWEVFLVDKLGFNWDEVHEIAEQLEHVNSEELVEKLDNFLDYPRFDPHGDPIPDSHGKMPTVSYQNLSELSIGQTAIMMGMTEHSPTFLQYLAKIGITLGVKISVVESNSFDKSLLIKINQSVSHFVSHEVAKNLLVKTIYN
jgi:DtxR family Mn-dependent transcriptional regulator